jgi:ribosomal-protein-alanine N-acetyltransferase
MKPPETLETKQLCLRQSIPEDAGLIFEQYAQDPKVTKYLSWHPHKSVRETDGFIERCISAWANHSAFPYVLTCKENA